MKPVYDDDFWEVKIHWSKPITYQAAKVHGSVYDDGANLYMISVRFSDKNHKLVYIGKTYKQNVQTRLKQPDHTKRHAEIVKNYPKHVVFVRYGKIKVVGGRVTEKRISDIENILIYCSDNGHSHNIKSIYSHGVTDSYEIANSGSRCALPRYLAFGFFLRA